MAVGSPREEDADARTLVAAARCEGGAPFEWRRTLLAVSLGGMMEWYDFAVFGYFIKEIAANFFPQKQSAQLRLIEAFGIFGGAFIARPVGGLVIGHKSDAAISKGDGTKETRYIAPSYLSNFLT